jgi:hypothetical protein
MDTLKRRVGALCAVVAFGVLAVISLGLAVIDWFESSWSFRSQPRQRLRSPKRPATDVLSRRSWRHSA